MRDNPHTWSFHGFKTYPIRYFGILLLILLRTFFASFWLLAGINKVKNEFSKTIWQLISFKEFFHFFSINIIKY